MSLTYNQILLLVFVIFSCFFQAANAKVAYTYCELNQNCFKIEAEHLVMDDFGTVHLYQARYKKQKFNKVKVFEHLKTIEMINFGKRKSIEFKQLL